MTLRTLAGDCSRSPAPPVRSSRARRRRRLRPCRRALRSLLPRALGSRSGGSERKAAAKPQRPNRTASERVRHAPRPRAARWAYPTTASPPVPKVPIRDAPHAQAEHRHRRSSGRADRRVGLRGFATVGGRGRLGGPQRAIAVTALTMGAYRSCQVEDTKPAAPSSRSRVPVPPPSRHRRCSSGGNTRPPLAVVTHGAGVVGCGRGLPASHQPGVFSSLWSTEVGAGEVGLEGADARSGLA